MYRWFLYYILDRPIKKGDWKEILADQICHLLTFDHNIKLNEKQYNVL